MNDSEQIRDFLNAKVAQYNRPQFITNDPICIPHRFTKKQDIELMGFWAAVLAWGQRVTIINKCTELIKLMDDAPHDFVCNHQESDLKRFLHFKHRTFNATDTLYFIAFFKAWYSQHKSLEEAFSAKASTQENAVERALIQFRTTFFSLPDFPQRTQKHVSSPQSGSTCKRLNMYLRWMVRKDAAGVDFGIWNNIMPAQLICPLDVHVERVARKLGLITRKQTDWRTAIELTQSLKQLDAADPIKYDFALFGLGIEEHF